MMEASPPIVVIMERNDYIVFVGELHNMSSATIWDEDPDIAPHAHFTTLAAIFSDHHAGIVAQEVDPIMGRPTYFAWSRGNSTIKLWPRCDQPYWFRATFRKPVGHGVTVSSETSS